MDIGYLKRARGTVEEKAKGVSDSFMVFEQLLETGSKARIDEEKEAKREKLRYLLYLLSQLCNDTADELKYDGKA